MMMNWSMGSRTGLLTATIAVMGCGATIRPETRAERCDRVVRTDPVLVSGESPIYTKEAFDAGVRGPVRAKCWISDQGVPVLCRLIDHVPSMDGSVLRALLAIRYRPALVDGIPTLVAIDVTVQLKPPPAGWSPPAPEPDPVKHALPMGMGMERPTLIAGAQPAFPPEERRKCTTGLVLARCVLNTRGTLEECRIQASTSPLLSKAVADVLPGYRYAPLTFQGRAVDVEYTIPFQFKLE